MTGLHSPSSDKRFSAALRYSPVVTTLIDASGAPIRSADSRHDLLGYPTQFWSTRTVFDVAVDEETQRIATFHESILASPGQHISIEVAVRAADGTVEHLDVRAINLIDEPSVNAIVLSTTNVTEQRRMVDELASQRDTAEAFAKAQTRLLATVSHELRNPLHVVQGLAELLTLENLSLRAAELVATLSAQLNGLASVTNDLLETARLDLGVVAIVAEPVDLADVIDDTVAYAKAAIGSRQVSVGSVWAPGSPTWIATDRARVRQILRNLVGNATKFTSRGSVRIEVRSTDDSVEISVVDTGVGIPLAEIGQILEPFQTGSTAGENKGAGLGLAIVHRLVEALGGTLTVLSTIGLGSTFTVALPLRLAEPPRSELPTEFVDRRITADAHVLVVEDNTVNQQLAVQQLHHLGMHAYVVGSGEAALAFLEDERGPRIDVVLMDYQLPGIDGLETARLIRTLPDALVASLPIIGVTASASSNSRDRFLAEGFDGFVPKPASMDDLRRGISAALAKTTIRHKAPVVIELQNAELDSVSSQSSAPFVSLDDLVADFGDRSIVEDLVQTYVGDLGARREGITHAIRTGDRVVASRIAHSLKSSSKFFGANELARVCQLVEDGQAVDTNVLDALIDSTVTRLLAWKLER